MELPLGRHNLGIGSRDLDTGKQAGLVVSFDNVSAEDLASTDTAVVWALRTGKTTYGPAVGAVVAVQKGVLLLQTEPWLVSSVGLHEFGSLVAVVELVRGSIGIPALSDDENIGTLAERIGVNSDWSKVDIGVVTWGLARGATVEIPLWKILELDLSVLWDLGDGLL